MLHAICNFFPKSFFQRIDCNQFVDEFGQLTGPVMSLQYTNSLSRANRCLWLYIQGRYFSLLVFVLPFFFFCRDDTSHYIGMTHALVERFGSQQWWSNCPSCTSKLFSSLVDTFFAPHGFIIKVTWTLCFILTRVNEVTMKEVLPAVNSKTEADPLHLNS